MAQEDKDLLLRDICARLPYGIIVHTDCGDMALDRNHRGIGVLYYEHYNEEAKKRCGYDETDFSIILSGCYYGDIKPYLRPMSSMTEEEVDHLFHILKINEENGKEWIKVNDIGIIRLFTEEGKDFYEIAEAMDYLHSIHIDYRGLISKGLALEAPENMYKIK